MTIKRADNKTMTVEQLISVLQVLPGNCKIVIASDPEGNEIRTLHHLEQLIVGTNVVTLWPGRCA